MRRTTLLMSLSLALLLPLLPEVTAVPPTSQTGGSSSAQPREWEEYIAGFPSVPDHHVSQAAPRKWWEEDQGTDIAEAPSPPTHRLTRPVELPVPGQVRPASPTAWEGESWNQPQAPSPRAPRPARRRADLLLSDSERRDWANIHRVLAEADAMMVDAEGKDMAARHASSKEEKEALISIASDLRRMAATRYQRANTFTPRKATKATIVDAQVDALDDFIKSKRNQLEHFGKKLDWTASVRSELVLHSAESASDAVHNAISAAARLRSYAQKAMRGEVLDQEQCHVQWKTTKDWHGQALKALDNLVMVVHESRHNIPTVFHGVIYPAERLREAMNEYVMECWDVVVKALDA